MKTEKFITRRIIAGLINYTIIFTLTYFYIFLFGEQNSENRYSVNGIKTFPIFIFWLIYICLIETTLYSTLRNFIVGLKPVDYITGKNITFKQSFLRHIVDLIDMMFFGIIAIIIVKNSNTSQRLGDLLAKTKVIRA